MEIRGISDKVEPISPIYPVFNDTYGSSKQDNSQDNSNRDNDGSKPALGEWQKDAKGRFILA
jgi:hypothetical protein